MPTLKFSQASNLLGHPPTQWIGCQECDVSFPCHEGRDKCIRLIEPEDKEIRCRAMLENNGNCPHHNLHCGWPDCNKK